MIRSLLATLLFAIGFAHAQTGRVSSLEWMAGSWTHDDGRQRVMESWVGPANGMMAAVNLTALPGGRRSFEFLRIVETGESMSYLASPGGRAPVEFKLAELGDKRVVFENLAHDFPQRIIYWMEGPKLAA
ncbi:MAG TPA: DUF6265 family protein, partial [Usitatibacter sp.]|nr:DUF6265 family protein [Usitatibacter sp.]